MGGFTSNYKCDTCGATFTVRLHYTDDWSVEPICGKCIDKREQHKIEQMKADHAAGKTVTIRLETYEADNFITNVYPAPLGYYWDKQPRYESYRHMGEWEERLVGYNLILTRIDEFDKAIQTLSDKMDEATKRNEPFIRA
jgi:hypothetical protein